ncbi:10809_t:CDS:1 [Funneliformis geosporum]|nr:10809_t:CDS:1 [Funneliformis geosporum]
MTCKSRKINKSFRYEYKPVTLKKIKSIEEYMVQQVTYNADKILRLTNPQIKYIIEQVKLKTITDQSHVNEIFETIATTSTYDSDDNFSAILNDTVYFKEEEGTNELIEKVSKKSEVSAPSMPILAEDDLDKMIRKTFEENEARIEKERQKKM